MSAVTTPRPTVEPPHKPIQYASNGSIAIPEATGTEPTSIADLDAAIADVAAQKDAWRTVSVPDRIALLDRMIDDTMAVAAEWNLAATSAKGIARDSGSRGEDFFTGPVIIIRNLKLLRNALQDLHATGSTGYGEVTDLPTGQIAAKVFPTSLLDNALFTGFTAEVVMQPGVTRGNLEETVAVAYKESGAREGKVSVVLGAGNVSSIGPMDALYKLFAEDEVVVLKMNPVNDYTGPFVAKAFAALVERDVLRVVYGGVEVGKHLTTHPDVDTLHMTGSDKTFDAVVYGGGAEGAANKAADTPINDKHFTSELGNVTPVIVVPGNWSQADIRFQALNIASMLVHNGGFNCIAARMIVTHRAWKQRDELLAEIRKVLGELEERHPYYPGARDRFEAFTGEHPEADTFGHDDDDSVPWTLIADLDERDGDDIAFTTEAFCGVFGEVGLDAPRDVEAFLRQATLFCNDTLWGTLGATVIVDPRTAAKHADALENTYRQLNYGCVVVNHFSGVPYAMVSTPWGAFPGATRQNIQSGTGFVHNTYLFDKPEKTIARGPFRMPVKPVWFANHKTAGDLGPLLMRIEGKGDLTAIPFVAAKAAFG